MTDRTVAFLFCDLEGSTRLVSSLGPDRYGELLSAYRQIVIGAASPEGGQVVDREGDGLFLVFPTAAGALRAAGGAQADLAAHPRSEELKVRMGAHAGEAQEGSDGYLGIEVHRAARVAQAAWGGQVLVSGTAAALAGDLLGDGLELRPIGTHHLKDFPASVELHQLIGPDLPDDFAPPRTEASHPHNLPVQLTSFVGRERELGEVTRLLEETRLLTLVGVGGSGKTRLALETASRALDRYPDGVWWVDLAPLGDTDLVPAETAGVLGVKEQPGRPLTEVLEGALGRRRLLLVLDNCEHLIDAVASLADRLLHAAPELRLLATSREGLGIGGEVLWQVPSLETSSEGVRLFAERARAVRPDFGLESEEETVAQICRRLDGLPLAIELAAARVRALSVEAIAARLDDRFRLLTGGSRTAVPRQQTLEAAVGWSYELLEDAERRLFGGLSVFSGGFTLEAAEEICSLDPIREDEVLDLLSSLVEKSLVVIQDERYRMLETIRQYAGDRLVAGGKSDEVRHRHARFYLELAEWEVARFRGSQPAREAALDRLTADYDNLRAALEWTAESPLPEHFQRLVVALAWYWGIMERASEGREWLEKALDQEWSDPVQQGRALLGLVGALRTHDYERAHRLAEEARGLFKAAGETFWLADALGSLSDVSWYRDDLAESEEYARRALTLYRELGYRRGAAVCLINLGRALRDRGDLAEAISCLGEVEGHQADVSPNLLINARTHLGVTLWYAGEHRRALDILEQALEAAGSLNDRWQVGHITLRLASVRASQGDHRAARQKLEESLPLLREIGDVHCAALATTALGLELSREGHGDGKAVLRDGLAANLRLGAKGAIAASLAAAGAACSEIGDEQAAVRLLGAAEALRNELEAPLSPPEQREHEYLVAALRNELGPEAFERAWTEGAALDMEGAVALGLEVLA